ncbi:hypothetical protein FRIGORI9N_350076 [Frigoribacterium sp. 9N]|nr:hypothetical protein FRIGORI9N_350076 [Frigoribacterium sp. 9N]
MATALPALPAAVVHRRRRHRPGVEPGVGDLVGPRPPGPARPSSRRRRPGHVGSVAARRTDRQLPHAGADRDLRRGRRDGERSADHPEPIGALERMAGARGDRRLLEGRLRPCHRRRRPGRPGDRLRGHARGDRPRAGRLDPRRGPVGRVRRSRGRRHGIVDQADLGAEPGDVEGSRVRLGRRGRPRARPTGEPTRQRQSLRGDDPAHATPHGRLVGRVVS